MPKASKSKKNYDKKYNARPIQKKNRALRNAARRKVIKAKGKAAVAGKDVHHIKPLRSGGSNSSSNLAIKSKSTNRADNGKRGGRKKKR